MNDDVPNPDQQRLLRDQKIRRRRAILLTPGLPVDADATEFRVPTSRVGQPLKGILDELLKEKTPFFDAVCAAWPTLFPELAARPGRFQNGRLFLYVTTSATLFALHPKLNKIKKQLRSLPGAPARFTVGLEIHAAGRTKP